MIDMILISVVFLLFEHSIPNLSQKQHLCVSLKSLKSLESPVTRASNVAALTAGLIRSRCYHRIIPEGIVSKIFQWQLRHR